MDNAILFAHAKHHTKLTPVPIEPKSLMSTCDMCSAPNFNKDGIDKNNHIK